MAIGTSLPLITAPDYPARLQAIKRLFQTPDAQEAWREARRLGVDYLYVDEVERTAYAGPGIEKFEAFPEYFVPVFRRGAVAIYAVTR
jgi:uncharacterized membrane protein